MIHQTAIVDPAAELDPSVEVGPYVIIEGPVHIGANTRILAHAQVLGRTEIGKNNVIGAGAIIGAEPQHLAYNGEDSGVIIGDKNVIREYVTIHRAYHAGAYTVIGNECFFMATSHVGHDSVVGNKVIMANGSLLAGHTTIANNANISGNVAIHQFVCVGRFAMIGGLSKIVKDIPPFMIADGPDGHIHGINSIGLRRNGFDASARDSIKKAYRTLYRSGLNVTNALEVLEGETGNVEIVREIIDFVKNSKRGISRHTSRPE